MNEEEKAVFDCLENSDQNSNYASDDYDMLEDDFVLMANEGQLGVDKEDNGEGNDHVHIIGPNSDDDEDMMPDDVDDAELKEYRLKMYEAVLKQQSISNSAVPPEQLQADIDANFDAFMDQEYNEDQIGELSDTEVQQDDQIDQKVVHDAVNEFIEDKKGFFRHLHKNYAEEGDVT